MSEGGTCKSQGWIFGFLDLWFFMVFLNQKSEFYTNYMVLKYFFISNFFYFSLFQSQV